jgi:hypothetical protein
MSVKVHHTTAVPVERAVTGTAIGGGEHALCGRCGRSIGEGSSVGIYAYSMSDECDITVARTSCIDCAPDTIAHPTLGGTEWLVRGALALRSDVVHQSHRLVFVPGEGVIDTSPPTDGSGIETEGQLEMSIHCRQR